jgi:hypothetical protein
MVPSLVDDSMSKHTFNNSPQSVQDNDMKSQLKEKRENRTGDKC